MIIANPIYDTVFKKMMENERVVKFFIGTLLGKQIEAVEAKPQEITYTNELKVPAIFRLDFIATIKTKTGELSKVLIEIQNLLKKLDIFHFRNYLREQYRKKDIINNQEVVLPIITIYILGFALPEFETACVKIDRNYIDLINNTVIENKSVFAEKLTHESFIVQADRITDRYQTILDKLLSVFEQKKFIDDNKTIKQFLDPTDTENVKFIIDILHKSGIDPEERKLIEIEEEAWRTIYVQTEDAIKELEILMGKEKVIEDKKKVIEDKDRVIAELKRKLIEK